MQIVHLICREKRCRAWDSACCGRKPLKEYRITPGVIEYWTLFHLCVNGKQQLSRAIISLSQLGQLGLPDKR
jgi:hypothetical protein